jgi:hypothetical protein
MTAGFQPTTVVVHRCSGCTCGGCEVVARTGGQRRRTANDVGGEFGARKSSHETTMAGWKPAVVVVLRRPGCSCRGCEVVAALEGSGYAPGMMWMAASASKFSYDESKSSSRYSYFWKKRISRNPTRKRQNEKMQRTM